MTSETAAPSTEEFELVPEHDIRNLHGAPGWHELTTNDPDAAAKFLEALYGWEVVDLDLGGVPYRAIAVNGHQVGGIREPMPGDDNVPRWDTYVTVADVDAIAEKAKDLGADVIVPPMQLGDAGRLTVMSHPVAGHLSAFQYAYPFQ